LVQVQVVQVVHVVHVVQVVQVVQVWVSTPLINCVFAEAVRLRNIATILVVSRTFRRTNNGAF
jgi:hypothetical protein